MTAERQLTLTVNNPVPGDGGVLTNGTGNWVDLAADFSIALVAWYSRDETRPDNAGVIRTLPANWLDITRLQAGNSLIIPYTVPVDHKSRQRYPDHYAAYYRSGATWDLSTPGIRIGGSDRFDVSLTSDKPYQVVGTCDNPAPSSTDMRDLAADFSALDDQGYPEVVPGDVIVNVTESESAVVLAVSSTLLSCTALSGAAAWSDTDAYEVQRTITLGSSATTFNLLHVMNFKEELKKMVAGSWNGAGMRISYWDQENDVAALNMTVTGVSFSGQTEIRKLRNFMRNALLIKVDQHNWEDNDENCFIETYYGQFENFGGNAGVRGMNKSFSWNLFFKVEDTVLMDEY